MYFKKVVDNIVTPMTGSPANGAGLQLACLSTIFNTVDPADGVRFNILDQVIKVVRSSSSFESIKPHLHSLDSWLEEWEVDEERERAIFFEIASAAHDASESDLAYSYLVRALRTFSSDDAATEDARKQSLRALRVALTAPTHFDFQDLTSLDSIQALRKSDPTYFELLELFTSEQLDDFADFKESNDGWLEKEGLDIAALDRKMRLLTLASLAASSQSRSLPYAQIANALQIPPSDVEMWVIDVIRAGLIEGKLSQLNQQFLIHRSTYRVFGENQWREVAARLDMWKMSLLGVLGVIRQQKEEFMVEKERETRDAEAKINGAGGGGYGRRDRERDRQPRQVEVDAD
jgi:translation initiation factor 3 subunit M